MRGGDDGGRGTWSKTPRRCTHICVSDPGQTCHARRPRSGHGSMFGHAKVRTVHTRDRFASAASPFVPHRAQRRLGASSSQGRMRMLHRGPWPDVQGTRTVSTGVSDHSRAGYNSISPDPNEVSHRDRCVGATGSWLSRLEAARWAASSVMALQAHTIRTANTRHAA
ncbi:hypothetical protein OH76DRAFT_709556 [Lentinus brumalis]|uniref:Uncharacterized protein n=1 Tax=Lentinus brumalis TaxID=2498619 RepID=A0A371CH03_9APHY|nr:hypothetical protein OH76DRAFT_709556 [Polyporus brumalis]